MNKYLSQLIQLSQYDKKMDSFEQEIAKVNKELNNKISKISEIENEISKIDQEIAELKIQISQTNIQISEFATKIKEASKKSASVKTERESKALGIEEDLAKEQLNAANDEIVRLEKILDLKDSMKSELNSKINSLNQDLEVIKNQNSAELDRIQNDRNEICKDKENLLREMNQKVLSFYHKIRKWANNTAVVPVRKQACYGCFMKINDKTFSAVIKADEITTCPHCGRIIYKETE